MRLGLAAAFVPALAAAQPLPPPTPLPAPPQRKVTARRGLTFEANVGIGFTFADFDGETRSSDASLAGLDLGLAGWFGRRLAIGVRLAGVQLGDEEDNAVLSGANSARNTVNLFFGPTAQYWFGDHLWAGGGIGFATFRQFGRGDGEFDGINGFGFDLRAGYSAGRSGSNNSVNVSIELNPCFYSNSAASGSLTSIAFLVGYQFL